MLESVEWSAVLSGAIALLALVLSMMLTLNLHLGMWRRTALTRFAAMLFLCLILFSSASLIEQILDGRPGNTARILLNVSCFCDYYFSGMLAFLFSGLMLTFADPQFEKKHLHYVLYLLGLIHTVLLAAGQLRGLFYYIDALNRYCRRESYPLALLPSGLMLLLDVWILLCCRSTLQKDERVKLWNLLLIPFAALILQIFVENVVPIAAITAALVLYLMLTEQQIEMYLKLAQFQFEDALRVEYRIEYTDFALPPMCLQPLVENALRHGVRRNKGGRGTVTVRASELENWYEVSVADDGPGLDQMKLPDRKRFHIGLSNVRIGFA